MLRAALVAAALATLGAVAPAAGAEALISRASSGEGAGRGRAPIVLAVTARGRRADISFDVRSRPGARVRVIVGRRFRNVAIVARTTTVAVGDDGTARIVWRRARRGPDRTLMAWACEEGAPCPASAQVVIHLRRLAIGLDSARAVAPGQRIPLILETRETRLTAAVYAEPWSADDPPLRRIGRLDPRRPHITVPPLPPGSYRLVVRDADENARALPLIVRTGRALGQPKPGTVLVLFPYLTWRGYNQWDGDDDGRPDTWYAYGADETGLPWRVEYLGPYQNPRVPAGAERDYANTAPLMAWLRERPRRVQVATDVDAAGMSPGGLARYSGILIAGHMEYVPPELYDLVRGYRDRGGRIALLSANGFYRHVTVTDDGHVVADPRRLRSAERSDFGLLGSGYVTCCFATRPAYVVQPGAKRAAPWLFRGTRLGPGSAIGQAATEVDGVGPLTPPQTVILAAATVPLASGGTTRSTITFLPGPRGGGVLNFANVAFLRSTASPGVPAPRRRGARAMLDNAWTWLAAGNGTLPPPDPEVSLPKVEVENQAKRLRRTPIPSTSTSTTSPGTR